MQRYRIIHQTTYHFTDAVQLLPHTLRLRPRDGHELRIESFNLEIQPLATLRWHRDVEGNSVAIAKFATRTNMLSIKSDVTIQQFDLAPLDFVVADYAVEYPFDYTAEDRVLLTPYLMYDEQNLSPAFRTWMDSLWQQGSRTQSFALLLQLTHRIFNTIRYSMREEEGVQSAEETLSLGTGSCRDLACLFMASARSLGIATRFVSGYLFAQLLPGQHSSTHAWVEALIPGAGWKGFDPTIGGMAGPHHFAVAVARLPESVPPVSGTFYGDPVTTMAVDVQVTSMN